MNQPKCIVLVGMPGSGKTTVGRDLAKRLGLRFVDTDHEIEARTGVKIPTIFEIEGEDGFRKRETQTLDDLTRESNMVLATGGGAVIRPENRALLPSARWWCS
jgi:shikimate kinase